MMPPLSPILRAGRAERSSLHRWLFSTVALFAVVLTLAPPAADPNVVIASDLASELAQTGFSSQATLTVLSAPVEVQRSSGSRDAASSGQTMSVGDRVITGLGGTAKLTFFQGTEVDISEVSEVMVQQLEQKPGGASTVGIGQALGSTVARVTSLFNPASRFQVNTPSAVAVVRGTTLGTIVTGQKLQIFSCFQGTCDIVAGGTTQRLLDGQSTYVLPPAPTPVGLPTRGAAGSGGGDQGSGGTGGAGGGDQAPVTALLTNNLSMALQTVAATVPGGLVLGTPTPSAGTPVSGAVTGTPGAAGALTPAPSNTPGTTAATVAPAQTATVASVATSEPQTGTTTEATMTPVVLTATPAGTHVPCSTPQPTQTVGAGRARIQGIVRDTASTPVPLFCASVHAFDGSQSAFTYTDAQGAYSVAVPVGATNYDILGSKSGYTQQSIPKVSASSAGATYTQDVALVPNDAMLSGMVYDGGAPASGRQVSVVSESFAVAQSTTTAGGSYSMGLASGTYDLAFAGDPSGSGGLYQNRSESISQVPINAGPNTWDFTLPTLSVGGTCSAVQFQCSMTLSGSGWFPDTTQSVTLTLEEVGGGGSSYIFAVIPAPGGVVGTSATGGGRPPAGTYNVFAVQPDPTFNQLAAGGPTNGSKQLKTNATYIVDAFVGTATSTSTTTATPTVTSTPTGTATPTVTSTPTATSTATVVGTSTIAAGQAQITGKVFNMLNSTPVAIANATVRPYPVASVVSSDANGNYAVLVPTGQSYEIRAMANGHTQVSIPVVNASASQTYNQDLSMNVNNATVSGSVTNAGVSNAGATTTMRLQHTPVGIPRDAATAAVSAQSYTMSVANAYYQIFVAEEFGGTTYPKRSHSKQGVSINPGANTHNFELPTLTLGQAVCEADEAQCTILVNGTNWDPNLPISLSLKQGGTSTQFGTTFPDASGAVNQYVTVEPSGVRPAAGSYTVNANQNTAGGGSYDYKALETSATYTVNALSAAPTAHVGGVTFTSTSCTFSVAWSSNVPADSQVEWGTSPAFGTSTAVITGSTTSHTVTVSVGSGTVHLRVRSAATTGGTTALSGGYTFPVAGCA